jgi:hypothetical protein
MSCTVQLRSGGTIYEYIPSFMEIDAGVQAVLRFPLRNFKGYIVGITDV